MTKLLVGVVLVLSVGVVVVGVTSEPEPIKADELCPKYPTCTQQEFLARRANTADHNRVSHQGSTKPVVVDIVDIELFGNGRYSVREAYSDRLLADQIVDRLRGELRSEFVTKAELLQAIRALRDEDPKEGWDPPQKPESEPEPMPKLGPVSKTQDILDAKCVSCHSGKRPPKGIDLTDETALGSLERSAVFGQISLGLMPPSAPLSDADAAVVGRWAAGK